MAGETVLDLPFPYWADVIPPARSTPVRVELKGKLLVPVACVSSSEAPVRLRASEGANRRFPVSEYRLWDGRLFVQLDWPRPMTLERFVASCNGGQTPDDRWARLEKVFPCLPGRTSSHPATLPDEHEWAQAQILQTRRGRPRWLGNDLDEARHQALEVLSRELLIVDGYVWTSSHVVEPYWAVDVGSWFSPAPPKIQLRKPTHQPETERQVSFAAHRLADALEFARAAYQGQGAAPDPVVDGRLSLSKGFVSGRDDLVELARWMLNSFGILNLDSLDADRRQAAERAHAAAVLIRSGRAPLTRDLAEHAMRAAALIAEEPGSFTERGAGGGAIPLAVQRLRFEPALPPAVSADDLDALDGFAP